MSLFERILSPFTFRPVRKGERMTEPIGDTSERSKLTADALRSTNELLTKGPRIRDTVNRATVRIQEAREQASGMLITDLLADRKGRPGDHTKAGL